MRESWENVRKQDCKVMVLDKFWLWLCCVREEKERESDENVVDNGKEVTNKWKEEKF